MKKQLTTASFFGLFFLVTVVLAEDPCVDYLSPTICDTKYCPVFQVKCSTYDKTDAGTCNSKQYAEQLFPDNFTCFKSSKETKKQCDMPKDDTGAAKKILCSKYRQCYWYIPPGKAYGLCAQDVLVPCDAPYYTLKDCK